MPLRACMQAHTHREYRTWSRWLELEWDKPSRSDWFLMQIAAEIRRVLSKKPKLIQLKHFFLKFTTGKSDKPIEPEMTKEEATRIAKNKWFGLVGYKPKKKEKKNGN